MKKILIGVGLVLIVLGLFLYLRKDKKIIQVEEEKVVKIKDVMFKFVVMADVHNDIDDLKKALEMEKVSLVVIAGDLTINGTEKEQQTIKNILNDNIYVIPGNHDDYKNVWIFGKKYQSISEGNFKMILIDNSNWRGLGEEQKKWIENEVQVCRVIKCVVVMHMPLENNFSAHIMGEYLKSTAEEAKWLKSLLLNNNVKTGYSGHLHYNSSYTIDGWQTVLVGAITRDRNTESPRYTEVTVYSDGSMENEVKIID